LNWLPESIEVEVVAVGAKRRKRVMSLMCWRPEGNVGKPRETERVFDE